MSTTATMTTTTTTIETVPTVVTPPAHVVHPEYQHIPIDLSPRFEVRRLEEKHWRWAGAIMIHSNMFYSPIWPIVYPENKCARSYRAIAHGEYLMRHQIESGHSFGIFDREYKYKREASRATGGALYWDASNPSTDETGDELLEQMDFPLCSVAMSYDGFYELDMQRIGALAQVLPLWADIDRGLSALDMRDPLSWKPTRPNQLLRRNATSSRRDIEGHGLMKSLAHFLMRYAASQKFEAIQINCVHDKVLKVWTHPPAPYRSTVVSAFNTWEYEIKAGETITKPFGAARQTITAVWCELSPEEQEVKIVLS